MCENTCAHGASAGEDAHVEAKDQLPAELWGPVFFGPGDVELGGC